jgi:predicted DNA-binding protein with PD1-like motif
MEVNGQLHVHAAFTLDRSAAGTHFIGGCVSPRAGMVVI